MKILNHLPLGPKKYLTVVEVAGETLLLGVTDYSVNLIKSLALLDEDLEPHAKTGIADGRFSQVIVDRMIQTDSQEGEGAEARSSAAQQDEFQITRMAEVVKDRIHTMGPLP
jgi:flagellar biogenesis protein FliO